MIEILIPESNSKEINYTLNVLFNKFLGVDFKTTITNTKDYQITFRQKTITINNDFFYRFNNELGYLKKENLPEKISLIKTKFTSETDIPLIFGTEEFRTEEDSIYCGIDIIASTFLMLTRWEEYVCDNKDKHDRFPSEHSLLQRFNLHQRPIVNEYLEMLWNMLVSLGYDGKRKNREYKVKVTHDIDWYYKYRNFNKYLRALGGDIVKRKNPLLLFKTTYEYFFSKLGIIKDPYNTFEKLMDTSTNHGFKSTFFFMASDVSKFDVAYNITDNKVASTIKRIKEKGHNVALHGTYNSYNDQNTLKEEIENMQNIGIDISECRQHFLRFKSPDTWQMYEDAGIKTDNNLGFENDIGFRAGVCYSYPVFNILTQKQLNLITTPFIIMDSVLIYNKNISKHEFIEKCKFVTEKVKKYNGTMQIIWHNNSHVNFYRDKIISLLEN